MKRLFVLWLSLVGLCLPFSNHHVRIRSTSTCYEMASHSESLLVTFDLDNTLFPVAPVVLDADVAMIKALKNLGCVHATKDRIHDHMRSFSRKTRKRLTYSELRLRAIHQELVDISHDDAWSMANDVFDVWLQERHASAERNLFSDVVETLQSLSSQATIGAITNGRGNPLNMNQTLAPTLISVSVEKIQMYFRFENHTR